METDLMLPVSGRQFAKMVGVSSDNAVRKAVERGSILKGYIKSEKKFIPKVAAMEWGKDILPEFLTEAAAEQPISAAKPKPKAKTAKAIDFDEAVKEIMHEKTDPLPTDFEATESDTVVNSRTTKPEAERVLSVLKAEAMKIAVDEKRGNLLARSKIAPVLFAYGQEIRIMIEGLPNRILDRVLACDTRHEAKRVMDEEINAMLTLLADIPNRRHEK